MKWPASAAAGYRNGGWREGEAEDAKGIRVCVIRLRRE
ncbi:hypothetical protein A2U01_0043615, partial [Trifolium medium]|nr:hypothetical protein [Trifolium medium]